MAIRAATETLTQDGMVLIQWSGLLNIDTGAPASISRYINKTFQGVGTFGTGGNVQIQGSNDGGTTWGALHDALGGTAQSTVTGFMSTVVESPLLLRPAITAGDGSTSITLYLTAQLRVV